MSVLSRRKWGLLGLFAAALLVLPGVAKMGKKGVPNPYNFIHHRYVYDPTPNFNITDSTWPATECLGWSATYGGESNCNANNNYPFFFVPDGYELYIHDFSASCVHDDLNNTGPPAVENCRFWLSYGDWDQVVNPIGQYGSITTGEDGDITVQGDSATVDVDTVLGAQGWVRIGVTDREDECENVDDPWDCCTGLDTGPCCTGLTGASFDITGELRPEGG